MTKPCATEVRRPKERRELGVPTPGLAQTAGVAEARSDRLSVEEFSPQTVSRPALALIRRQTRSERSGWPTAGVEPCSGVPCIGVRGWAYNQCAQGVCRHCCGRIGERGDGLEGGRRKGNVPGELVRECIPWR